MRWGILGTGGIARAFTTDLANLPDHTVVAVGSRTKAAADDFGDRFAVPHRHVGVEALVADPDVEAVYVATPHTEHAAGALAAIAAGKHVLVEKPFTVNAFQAQQVVDAARARGVVVLEAMWTRFLPHVARLRELLADKAIGEVRTVYADHGQWFAYDPRFRLFDHSVGGGALLDLGIYPVSWAHLVLGTPSAVTAVGDFTRTGVDAQTSVVLQYPGGAHAVLTTTLEALTPRRAWISGTEGTIEVDPTFYALTGFTLTRRDGHVERYETPAEIVGPRESGWGKGLRFEAAELARCVAEGLPESPLLPLDETVAVMRTMDEIRRQIGLVYDGEPGRTSGPTWSSDGPEELIGAAFGEEHDSDAGDDGQVDLLLGVLGVPYLDEAGCLTFVAGADVDEVLTTFGADTSSPMSLDEAVDAMVDTVTAVRTPDGVVAAEYNGFQGSRPEVLRVLADDGRAASMFWNVNAVTRLTLAEDGATVGGEEILGLDEATAPDLPLDLLPDLVEAARTLSGVEAAGVRAAARWAGFDLSAVHFGDDVVLYPLLPVADDFRPTSPEVTTLAWSEPDLVARIVAASSATQRAIAEWCALDLLREAGLEGHPAVVAVTAGFGNGLVAPMFQPAADLREIVRRECEVLRRTDPSRHGGDLGPALHVAQQRLSALDALRHACWPVGVEAALGALEHSVRGGPAEHRALREVRLLLDRG